MAKRVKAKTKTPRRPTYRTRHLEAEPVVINTYLYVDGREIVKVVDRYLSPKKDR